jgi:hypothetical protein
MPGWMVPTDLTGGGAVVLVLTVLDISNLCSDWAGRRVEFRGAEWEESEQDLDL